MGDILAHVSKISLNYRKFIPEYQNLIIYYLILPSHDFAISIFNITFEVYLFLFANTHSQTKFIYNDRYNTIFQLIISSIWEY